MNQRLNLYFFSFNSPIFYQIDLMGGQMQIYEMVKQGLSYVNDPKQLVLTKDQSDVVTGILSGRYDVGFIGTNQIETSKNEDGSKLDPDLFKIIEPNFYVMENGDLFPFLHSTEIFPEWPFAALLSVPWDVATEVQQALLKIGEYSQVHLGVLECGMIARNETKNANLDVSFCKDLDPSHYNGDAPCETTYELAEFATEATLRMHAAGFRPSRSYWALRDMQQTGGFMLQDEKNINNYFCTRPSNLYEGIVCPEGYFKRNEVEFTNGCAQIGLSCDQNENYDCFCKPCVRAFDVDVYEYKEGDVDVHLQEYYGESLPGCEKMSICGEMQQGETITIRIYDNKFRENPRVDVIAHAGDKSTPLKVKRLEGTMAYEVQLSDTKVQMQVVDVIFDGKPVSQSPVRVNVQPYDCDADYGEKSKRVPNEKGECVCMNNTYQLGDVCLESAFFFLIIFAGVFVVSHEIWQCLKLV